MKISNSKSEGNQVCVVGSLFQTIYCPRLQFCFKWLFWLWLLHAPKSISEYVFSLSLSELQAILSNFFDILFFIIVSFQSGLSGTSYINTATIKQKFSNLQVIRILYYGPLGTVSAWISFVFQRISLYGDWSCCMIGGREREEKIGSAR